MEHPWNTSSPARCTKCNILVRGQVMTFGAQGFGSFAFQEHQQDFTSWLTRWLRARIRAQFEHHLYHSFFINQWERKGGKTTSHIIPLCSSSHLKRCKTTLTSAPGSWNALMPNSTQCSTPCHNFTSCNCSPHQHRLFSQAKRDCGRLLSSGVKIVKSKK